MFSSLSDSFPVVSNLVSEKVIETRKGKETEKDTKNQLQYKTET